MDDIEIRSRHNNKVKFFLQFVEVDIQLIDMSMKQFATLVDRDNHVSNFFDLGLYHTSPSCKLSIMGSTLQH